MAKCAFSNILLFSLDEDRDDIENTTLPPLIRRDIQNTDAKTNELIEELKTVGSENTKLSSKNKALRSKVESMVSVEVDLEAKLESTEEGRRQAEHRALESQSLRRMVENTHR
ncbi:hypothetical protein Fot_57145 [Forsythia ovata]|uniref:Uncharacterized protein n=1 Tax=Forsythia ovata TaxID=205694 RepID=A0ABD1NWM5_9LAMI